jgi:hypothetical protein
MRFKGQIPGEAMRAREAVCLLLTAIAKRVALLNFQMLFFHESGPSPS